MATLDTSESSIMPRVSVIMGIYNCASTLAEALDSLLAQTFQDFVVIMCDDASSDNTPIIAQEYVENYPDKFVLIRNAANLKLAATLNKCLKYVETEYVARMDGDDLCDPSRFAVQVKFLDDHPEYSHVSTGMKLFDEDGFYGATVKAVKEPSARDFLRGTPYFHAPSMFRKSAFDKINGYTADAKVERVEDYYLWYKFHKAGLQGYNLPDTLYSMRNDKNAFARRKFKDRIRSCKVKIEVTQGLGLPIGRLYAYIDVCKGLVPASIIRLFRKYTSR